MIHRRLVPNALAYAGYFAAVGVFLPHLPPYLHGLGITPAEVGLLLALQPVLGSFVPTLWGYAADHLGRRVALLRVALAGALLACAILLVARGLSGAALAIVCYALFASAVVPLLDAVTMASLGRLGGTYARVRLFGSLGFVAAAFGVGAWLGRHVEAADPRVALSIGGGLLVAFLATLGLEPVPPGARIERPHLRDALALLRDRRLVALFLTGGLHWLAMTPYHAYFGLHLEALGHPPLVAGAAMAFGALAEVGVLASAERLLAGRDPGRVLTLAAATNVVRWALTGLATDPWVIVALQGLHAASFGLFYVAALALLVQWVPDRLRATGQGLFVSTVFGVSGGLGTLVAGPVYERAGGRGLFLAGAGVSALAAILAWTTVRRRG